MLKLPGRAKKSVKQKQFLSPYKQLVGRLTERKDVPSSSTVTFSSEDLSLSKTPGVVKFQNIQKSFGKHLVLSRVHLEIKPGKILGIIGESGSGKTTLLRLMIGFYKPTDGVILFNGKNIFQQRKLIHQSFGFATQEDAFYDNLTTEENLRFFGKLYGLANTFLDLRIAHVLHLVDLTEARRVLAKNLSGGMQRRLDIACALVHDPSVLILDEPTEDLDPHLRASLLNLIRDINKKGTTVVFTTHLLGEAEYLCDEIAIISQGTVLRVGTPHDLRASYPSGDKIHLVLERGDYQKYRTLLSSFKTVVENGRLIIYVPSKKNSIDLLKKVLTMVERNNDHIILADIRKPNLGEVFSILTKNVKRKQG